LIIAALNYFLERVGQQILGCTGDLVFVVLVVRSSGGTRWLIERLKERITYPRTRVCCLPQPIRAAAPPAQSDNWK
jgi:hypothetical protein